MKGANTMASTTLPLETTREGGERTGAKNVAVGVVILIALTVAGLFAMRSCTAEAASVKEVGVVYIEGLPEIKRGMELSCLATPVGSVRDVTPGILGLQLNVVNPRWVDHRETMTITRGEFCEIGPQTTIKLNDDYTATIADGMSSVSLERVRKGTWAASMHDGEKLRALLRFTTKQFRSRMVKEHRRVLLYAGDVLHVGELEVYWADLARFTKIAFEISVNRLCAVTDSSFGRNMTLAPGTTIGLSGGIGITKPMFKLQPVLVAKNESHRLNHASAQEYSPMHNASIEQLVATLSDYLTSPNKMYAPPSNRFEKIVSDANLTMASLADAAPKVNQLVDRISNRTLPDAEGALDKMKTLASGADSAGLLNKLLSRDHRDSLDAIVKHVAQLARYINTDTAAVLKRLLTGKDYSNLDSALASFKHFGAKVGSQPLLDVLLDSSRTRKDVIEKVGSFPTGAVITGGLGAVVLFELLQTLAHLK